MRIALIDLMTYMQPHMLMHHLSALLINMHCLNAYVTPLCRMHLDYATACPSAYTSICVLHTTYTLCDSLTAHIPHKKYLFFTKPEHTVPNSDVNKQVTCYIFASNFRQVAAYFINLEMA